MPPLTLERTNARIFCCGKVRDLGEDLVTSYEHTRQLPTTSPTPIPARQFNRLYNHRGQSLLLDPTSTNYASMKRETFPFGVVRMTQIGGADLDGDLYIDNLDGNGREGGSPLTAADREAARERAATGDSLWFIPLLKEPWYNVPRLQPSYRPQHTTLPANMRWCMDCHEMVLARYGTLQQARYHPYTNGEHANGGYANGDHADGQHSTLQLSIDEFFFISHAPEQSDPPPSPPSPSQVQASSSTPLPQGPTSSTSQPVSQQPQIPTQPQAPNTLPAPLNQQYEDDASDEEELDVDDGEIDDNDPTRPPFWLARPDVINNMVYFQWLEEATGWVHYYGDCPRHPGVVFKVEYFQYNH